METRPPTITRILIAVAFALSCFGLLLFLWLAFGGPVPLKPEGYRFQVPFTEATQLAEESDVRISGVSVGKVKRIDLDDAGNAVATIELESEYAPIPADTRATLRQKTLLGETYVELTSGSDESGSLAEGGTLPGAQVAESVQLDEVFRTFDARTRAAFQTWMQGAAGALRGRGADLSVALASLDDFAAEADRVLRVLDSQRLAVRGLVRDGGEVFTALSERRGQLSGLIRNSAAVFETTARRDDDLRRAFTILPTFLRESRTTLGRLDRFAADTDPLVTQLRPAARELPPTLTATGDLAGELRGFFAGLREVEAVSPRGFSALRELLDADLPPLLERLDPFLTDLTPILIGLDDYRREVTAFLANVAAATNAENDEGTGPRNYLRLTPPFNPELIAAYPTNRLSSNRTNPYTAPRGYDKLAENLDSFETAHCSGGINAILDPETPSDPDFLARFPLADDPEAEAQDLFNRIQQFVFADSSDAAGAPQPSCSKQAPFASVGGAFEEFSDYQHVRALP
jgi:phospholipid/cholesterol/gamma-HCH transport system substrate-binding protein